MERAKILTRSLVSMDSVDDINISGPNRCSLTADDMVLFTNLKEQVMYCKKVHVRTKSGFEKNTWLAFQLGEKLSKNV